MTHTYKLTGMTCSGCESKVKSDLFTLPDVTEVIVSKDSATATISMEKHIPLAELQKAIGGTESKYQISTLEHNETQEQVKSWFSTYKPILLLFSLITLVSIIASIRDGKFQFTAGMNYFMAGFFLSFSYFKLINLSGFAVSYAMYDIIAKKWKLWGYIYACIELGLGIAFLVNFNPLITNSVTLLVMSISIIGVLQTVFNKEKIKCACLGAVFNIPMSTVTIIEDLLMILMSGSTIIMIVH
jgi:copper chaperone CopZ